MTAAADLSCATTYDAPAKINLALHVCGRRDDGYHLLDSLVVFADIGDRIAVSECDTLKLEITGPFGGALSHEPNNLVLRAARLLQTVADRGDGACIRLEKNLPVASGIGGGSSDAAATLRACGALWNVDPAQISNARLAADLGADIPVCVHRKPAFMSGIGEMLDAAPTLPPCWLVLANPGRPLATKNVFAALPGFSPPLTRRAFNGLADAEALAEVLKEHRNDLAAPAIQLEPTIAATLSALENSPDCLLARLSGSGPTCFGVFANARAAENAATLITAQHPDWWVTPTQVLTTP